MTKPDAIFPPNRQALYDIGDRRQIGSRYHKALDSRNHGIIATSRFMRAHVRGASGGRFA